MFHITVPDSMLMAVSQGTEKVVGNDPGVRFMKCPAVRNDGKGIPVLSIQRSVSSLLSIARIIAAFSSREISET
jgi:hypothetical protein